MVKGKVIVITFATLFVLIAVGTTVARYMLFPAVGLNQAGIGLVKVQQAALVWAQGQDDQRYPQHIALLRANNYFRASLLRDPRQPVGTVWDVNGFDAQPFLEEVVLHRDSPRLDRDPLLEAVANDPHRDDAIYRFGDYYFVRLERPTGRSDIVFGWTLPDDAGERIVALDDGTMRRVAREGWSAIWKADAVARANLDLPVLDAPAID